jgi:hypothetical protein
MATMTETNPPESKYAFVGSWADSVEDDDFVPLHASAPVIASPSVTYPKPAASSSSSSVSSYSSSSPSAPRRDGKKQRQRRPPASSGSPSTGARRGQQPHRVDREREHDRGTLLWETSEPFFDGTPALLEYTVFLIGLQKYDDAALMALLTESKIKVKHAHVLRNHVSGASKAYGLAVLESKEQVEELIARKLVLWNTRLPERDTIRSEQPEPWEARDDQDAYTVHLKGVDGMTAKDVRDWLSVLAPGMRTVKIVPGRDGKRGMAFVTWENTLCPFLAIEMFDWCMLRGSTVRVELARLQK